MQMQSSLTPEVLAKHCSKLALQQIQYLLLNGDQLSPHAVMDPGTAAFDYGLTKAEFLLSSLEAAQVPITQVLID